MASGSRIGSGIRSGHRSAPLAGLALLFATCACGSNAAAASPERARPWLGCYRITVGLSAHDLLVRQTDEPDGYDGYSVEFIRAPDREDMNGGWKPLPKTGFHISVGNGVVGWRADLRPRGGKFVGDATHYDDTGREREGQAISATRVTCSRAK